MLVLSFGIEISLCSSFSSCFTSVVWEVGSPYRLVVSKSFERDNEQLVHVFVFSRADDDLRVLGVLFSRSPDAGMIGLVIVFQLYAGVIFLSATAALL